MGRSANTYNAPVNFGCKFNLLVCVVVYYDYNSNVITSATKQSFGGGTVLLSVCLFVYLLAGFRKNYWTKLDQILTEYCPNYRIEPINFSEVKVKYQGHRGVKRF